MDRTTSRTPADRQDDDALTGRTWLGQWFSACDFELKRIDEKKK